MQNCIIYNSQLFNSQFNNSYLYLITRFIISSYGALKQAAKYREWTEENTEKGWQKPALQQKTIDNDDDDDDDAFPDTM